MGNAVTPANTTITDGRYSYVEVRFGRFAVVTNRAKATRELLSNAAAQARVTELLAAGWEVCS